MKTCAYCGLENSDAAVECETCRTPLPEVSQAPSDAVSQALVSTQESAFWARMNFKQFALLMVRLQAVWMIFFGVLDATYLPRYFMRWIHASGYGAAGVSGELKRDFALALFRVVLYFAGAMALIRYAERFLSWVVRDWVAQQTENVTPPSTAPGKSDSTPSPGGPA